MNTQNEHKRKKTFPLEIEDNLHKALKHKAIESDMSLHAYIIEALALRVREDSVEYTATSPKNNEQIGKP
jgi:predicted HicB family RNase H-like nuclease